MPLTATQSSIHGNELVADDMLRCVFSTSGQQLSESWRNSIKEFLRLETIHPHIPPIATDVISTSRKPLRDTLIKVHKLLSWGPNWNSYDVLAPNPKAIAYAEYWIVSLFHCVEGLRLIWIKPYVTASPDGEVVFEWRHGERKLTIYVGDQTVDYVQVWGTTIHAKITDGEIESIRESQLLWMWLVS